MSDPPIQPEDREDQAIERVVAALERGDVPEAASEDEQAYVELAGLLPRALAPVRPRPGLLASLLAQVSGRAPARGDVVPFVRAGIDQREAVARGARPSRGGFLLAAAVLGALAAGLGALSLWLVAQVSEQRAQITRLEGEMESARVALLQLQEVQVARERLRIAVDPAVKVCALRPPKAAPSGRGAGEQGARGQLARESAPRGLLYVQPQEKRWVLSAERLRRCPQGRLFQVWFVTDSGFVHGGTFQIEEGKRIEIAADHMPEGTRAVEVRLEFGQPATAHTGEVVLYGDDLHSLL